MSKVEAVTKRRANMGVVSAAVLGLMAFPAAAQNNDAAPPKKDPGTSTGVGNTPMVGTGATGNGGVVSGTTKNTSGTPKQEGKPDGATPPKDPVLSK